MRRETNQWLMAFSVSFGVTFLAMAVVLGGICFVSYTRTGLGMAEVEKPQAARPEGLRRLLGGLAGRRKNQQKNEKRGGDRK